MTLGKKHKPQALRAEQVKHVLDKNNRTMVKIMQLLEYQNKRKDRSDAVSRKIEKLKMRLNRRLVKLAKAMDAPAERAAADGYERANAAAVARAAARQQSRKAAAGASGAMPMRSGMTPYDIYRNQYDMSGLGTYNPATAPFYRAPGGLGGMSSGMPAAAGMGQSNWYGYGANAYHDPQAAQGSQQHGVQGLEMFSQQQIQSLIHSLGPSNLSALLQLQKQSVQNASMQMNMQDGRSQMQGMQQPNPHMYQQYPPSNFQQPSYPPSSMPQQPQQHHQQHQQHHQYPHQQQMPHPQAQGVMGAQQYPQQPQQMPPNLGHMQPGAPGQRHP